MPRPERPLDDEAGPLSQFAADLRELRRATGGMTYRAMAKKAHFSATVLSEAAAGRKLPTIQVTLAYVRACGGDPAEWTARWQALAGDQPATAQPSPAPSHDRAQRSPSMSRRRVALIATSAAVVAAVTFVVVLVGQSDTKPDQTIVMPEQVVGMETAGPDATPAPGEPPSGLPCSTHARAVTCVDLRQNLVWVKDLPPPDGHHAAAFWTTTTGTTHGQCHNYLKSTGPWVTCPYTDPVREPTTLGFRSAVMEEEKVLEWGPYITVPTP